MASVSRVINKLYNSGFGKFLANEKATVATAAAIATVSNVSKDAVNCAYYTTQSLHNDRIPEDQRKFVGALDLSNGLMNVGIQLIMAFGISDAIKAIFNDKIAKTKEFSLDKKVLAEKYAQLSEKARSKATIEEYTKYMTNRTNLARMGFTILVVNIAMQILTKRIITPLIATPLASVFKKKFEEADAKKAEKANDKTKEVAVA